MSNEINIEELEQSASEVKGWRCDCSWTDTSDGIPVSVVGTIDEEGNKHPVVFVDDDQCLCGDSGSLADFYAIANPSAVLSLIDRLKKAEAELERERMRLAACGVVAMADTPESAAKAREMRDEYRSASCDDVARRVDECMTLRAERDALARDAERYRWIRGGSRIGVKWCELYSGGAALDEAIDSTMKALPSTTAKARFDKAGGYEEPDPIERLRFFCSKAISGQDWLDVEQFFDAMIAERDTLSARLAELEGQEPVAWIYDWQAPEGLIRDWSTNNAAEIPKRATHIRPLYARPVSAEPVNAHLLTALIQCRDRFDFYVGHHLDKGDLEKAAENEKFVAIANDAISAAESAPKAVRLTDEEVDICFSGSDGTRISAARAIETAVLRKNGIKVAE